VVPAGVPQSIRHHWLAPAPIRLVAALAGGLLAGCGGGDLVLPTVESAANIQVVEGNGQQAKVGELLPGPIVVEVTDSAGNPVPGAEVEFVLVSAGDSAQIAPASTTTDQQGRAEARMLLGDKVGLQTGEARLGQGANPPRASFTAVATADTGSTPPPQQNQPPRAEFQVSCTQLTCGFTDQSTDDQAVTAWAWDFGDGTTSTEQNPTHTYSASGTYHVTLTVTDGSGAQDSKTHDANAQAPAPPPPQNEPPTADFDVHCTHLDCSFTDKSKDEDGVVVGWHWDFGDGETSMDPSPEHSYARRGHYQVTLTVTDDGGATDTKTHTVDAKR
jgi:PKD repeat protein